MVQARINRVQLGDLQAVCGAPGCQYIVADFDGILEEYNCGIADVWTREVVTSDTTFNNFSVTKTATAAAVMKLAEQGKLLLTDYVNPMFNEFHFRHKFTLQQLLSHEAGFGDPIPISWVHLANDEQFDETTFIRKTIDRHSRQHFVPGTRFKYSSVGYLLLSEVIRRVSGSSYEGFISQQILSHVHGGTLGFEIPDANKHATGYHPRYSWSNVLLGLFLDRKSMIAYNDGKWTAFNNFYVNGKAYGGFIGNARGLISYLQSYLNNSLFDSPSYVDRLFEHQLGGMALGWFTGKLDNNRYVCHAGGGGGYYCEIRIYPDRGIATVFVRNKSSFTDQRLLDKLDASFF